jgi:asparaginyl-tRNA synthetase
LHTPVITASDCEGAGEMFQVTTLLSPGTGQTVKKGSDIPVIKETGEIDYSKDFFDKPAYLTVSGQLNGEQYACALSNIYTFGPTFRAENSFTVKHLAEFWMIEPEMAFYDLQDNMDLAEAYLKFCIKFVLEHCPEDMEFFDKEDKERGSKPTLIPRLKHVLETPFKRVTYTEAVEALIKSGHKFEVEVKWGLDLGTEHERYLTEQIFKMPTIVTDYPKDFKAFYMRLNEDGKTVRAMDVLVPRIGEIIGGSQREERLDVLLALIKEKGLNEEAYSHYLDLRRFGTVPHSGFGLGFERLVMFTTGLENIRDVIPFPRWPKHAQF